MKAIVIDENKKLNWVDIEDPKAKESYAVIQVKAAALNRADLLQRAGKYPSPPNWPDRMGLECAGIICEVAENSRWRVGDKVCALLGGGGYAEKVLVPENMIMPMPENVSFEEAAALPEVYATAFLNLHILGDLKKDETLFVQAGASGLGIAAIQLGKLFGAKVVTTVSSDEKGDAVKAVGADVIINRKREDVSQILVDNGIDMALDCAGGALLGKSLNAMNNGGRWILVSTLGGESSEIPLRVVLKKHLKLIGSTLRSRSDKEKGEILQKLVDLVWPEIASGKIKIIIDKVFPIEEAEAAHAILEKQANIGKVVLRIS